MRTYEYVLLNEWHQIGRVVKELNGIMLIHVNTGSILLRKVFFEIRRRASNSLYTVIKIYYEKTDPAVIIIRTLL